MSEHDNPHDDKPLKKQRAKKAPTGRPRGRPPKRTSFLVPSEVRRTLLAILDEEIEIRTGKGIVKTSNFEAILRSVVVNAAKGNATSLNHLMRIMVPALEDRLKAHKQVWAGEYLREESESPDPDRQVSYKEVRVQFNFAKGMY